MARMAFHEAAQRMRAAATKEAVLPLIASRRACAFWRGLTRVA